MSWLTTVFSNIRKTKPPEPSQPEAVYGSRRSISGSYVSDWNATQNSAVWACLKVIGEDLAILPWKVFSQGAGGQTIPEPNHPVWKLLYVKPNPRMTPFTFKELLVRDAVSYGNGFAEIARDTMGRPQGLFYIHPSRVKMVKDDDSKLYFYEVRNDKAEIPLVYIPEADMFHLKGPSRDGLMGYSVFDQARNAIGLGLSAEQHGASWFGNSVQLSGTLSVPAAIGPEAKAELRESWSKMYTGNANKHTFAILDNGAVWTPMTTSAKPVDVQNLETRKFQTIEVCRFFRVPPYKIFSLEDAKFANIEEQSLSYFRDTILPWVTRLEEEADLKLLGKNSLFTRMDVKTHQRGRMSDLASYYETMSRLAVMSPNMIKDDLDLPPVEGGDNLFMQKQMRTMEQIIEGDKETTQSESTVDEEARDEV